MCARASCQQYTETGTRSVTYCLVSVGCSGLLYFPLARHRRRTRALRRLPLRRRPGARRPAPHLAGGRASPTCSPVGGWTRARGGTRAGPPRLVCRGRPAPSGLSPGSVLHAVVLGQEGRHILGVRLQFGQPGGEGGAYGGGEVGAAGGRAPGVGVETADQFVSPVSTVKPDRPHTKRDQGVACGDHRQGRVPGSARPMARPSAPAPAPALGPRTSGASAPGVPVRVPAGAPGSALRALAPRAPSA